MRVIKYFITILIFLMLLSCEIDPEQMIPVHIVNNASEDLNCNNGTWFSFVYTIPKNSSYTVTGMKGVGITLTGKESKKKYGTRTFYSEGTWVVD